MSAVSTPAELAEWEKTTLWKQLLADKSAEADTVRTALKSSECMPKIHTILAQANTSPLDFTLHDSGHAFRVAERMVEVIPDDVLPKLSPYELGLLLLSAYLHDIGMTPERCKVTGHYTYLLTGKVNGLGKVEVALFQAWLDDQGGEIVPPLTETKPTLDDLRQANELITYYCRHRHNDWSEDWIRINISHLKLGVYAQWIDDLVSLCRSHHEGFEELRSPRFDPVPIAARSGSSHFFVHRRYLAAVLRIADILENDPERTPEVILRHREIAPGSLIYWQKDHELAIIRNENKLAFYARPSSARVHRALEVVADQIEDELKVCRRLDLETHFGKATVLGVELPHRWDFGDSLQRVITPKNDSYEYISGSFRPDTGRLLNLLSGVELYGDRVYAVRELLQNAFDAVKEQIARERLTKPSPGDHRLEREIGMLHHVRLSIENRGNEAWLVCTDDGVGMSKRIIQDYLLVSGSARRHEIIDLERKCKTAGFPLNRTGNFGIGVLSYFMMGDTVRIRTRRSQAAGDAETNGWYFETEGIDDFGELRQDAGASPGTEVSLRISTQVDTDELTSLFNNLRRFLSSHLVSIPCNLSFECRFDGCDTLEILPGWVPNIEEYGQKIGNQLSGIFLRRKGTRLSRDQLSNIKRQQLEIEEEKLLKVKEEISASIRWITDIGFLPNKLGKYRIHIPFFELGGGRTLAFLRVRERAGKKYIARISDGFVFVPGGELIIGWNGTAPQRHWRDPHSMSGSAFAEIDFDSPDAGRISVDRNSIAFSELGKRAMDFVNLRTNDLKENFARENESCMFATLNYRILNLAQSEGVEPWWQSPSPETTDDEVAWEPMSFPAISSMAFAFGAVPKGNITWNKKSVSIVPCLTRVEDTSKNHYDGFAWNSSNVAPDRVVLMKTYRNSVVPLWAKPTNRKRSTKSSFSAVGLCCLFPPRWKSLCGVLLDNYSEIFQSQILWNANHPLITTTDDEAWDRCRAMFEESLDPLPDKLELLSNRSLAAACLIKCLIEEEFEMWRGLPDRDAEFLPIIWTKIFGRGAKDSRGKFVPVLMRNE